MMLTNQLFEFPWEHPNTRHPITYKDYNVSGSPTNLWDRQPGKIKRNSQSFHSPERHNIEHDKGIHWIISKQKQRSRLCRGLNTTITQLNHTIDYNKSIDIETETREMVRSKTRFNRTRKFRDPPKVDAKFANSIIEYNKCSQKSLKYLMLPSILSKDYTGCTEILRKTELEKAAFGLQRGWQEEHRKQMLSQLRQRHNAVSMLEQRCGVFRNPGRVHHRRNTKPPEPKPKNLLEKLRAISHMKFLSEQNTFKRKVDYGRIKYLGRHKEPYESPNKFENSDFRGMILPDYQEAIYGSKSFTNFLAESTNKNQDSQANMDETPVATNTEGPKSLLTRFKERIKKQKAQQNAEYEGMETVKKMINTYDKARSTKNKTTGFGRLLLLSDISLTKSTQATPCCTMK